VDEIVPRRPLRIAFWGNFGTGNWGNECTLQAIIHNTRRKVPDAELSCFCFNPDDTMRRHGLPSFPITSLRIRASAGGPRRSGGRLRVLRRLSEEAQIWAETVALARRADVIVMAGTGMLTDSGEGAMGMPYDMFKWSLAAKATGRKLMFASVGVEAIRSPRARFFITTALRLADYRSYRDNQSKLRLEKIGFATGRDPVLPDLAFSLPGSMAKDRRELEGRSETKPTIGVGLYDHRGRGLDSPSDAVTYREYVDKVASFVLWLLEHGYPTRVIIGDLTYDEPVLEDLRVVLAKRGIERYAGRYEDSAARSVEQVMDQIASLDLVVASRFHNVLLALMLGKPVVSISYNEKNDALMGEMGMGEYCRPIESFDLDWLIDRVEDLERNGPLLRPRIVQRAAQFRDQLEKQYAILFGTGAPK
jgi:polysaccharide pyruvyl transferase WcaK-like protein